VHRPGYGYRNLDQQQFAQRADGGFRLRRARTLGALTAGGRQSKKVIDRRVCVLSEHAPLREILIGLILCEIVQGVVRAEVTLLIPRSAATHLFLP
jgi:hypothetical protein